MATKACDWYGHNAVGFFLTAGFLGIMYYFVPKQAGRPVYSYRLSVVHFWFKIVNMHDEPLRWHIRVAGIPGLRLEAERGDREVAPGEVASVPVRLDAPRDALRSASTPVRFTIEALGAGDVRASEEARFLGPAARGGS